MEDIQLLETVERYIQGEMNPEELRSFEQLRTSNAEIDQMVVEYTAFLHQLKDCSERRNFTASLEDIHEDLKQRGGIKDKTPEVRVIDLMTKYSRVFAVAASIAGFTALAISGLVAYFTPKTNIAYVQQLSRKVLKLEQNQHALSNHIINEAAPKIPTDANVKSGGTSFLIDVKGYLVTNAHIIGDNTHVVVQNNKGHEFKANIIRIDRTRDLAILKIEDPDFKSFTIIPYGFKKSGAELGEEIFTLGYPRDEIVYGEGYMSARTGFNGDTLACQIAVAANPGNSGGPVINKNGEVVGILSTRQIQAEGVVFALKSKNIFSAIDDLIRDTASYQHIKINANTSIRGLDRVQQIRRIQDCIFMVKTY